MEKIYNMTLKDLDRYNTVSLVLSKRMTQLKAAELLGVSDRHFRRLIKKYKEGGASALISKRTGSPSNNRFPEEKKEKALKLLSSKYKGFGPTLASEKLLENEDIKVSKETVRKWMIAYNLWKGKKRRSPKIHQSRLRRSSYGELIQVDGSPHDWFEGRRPKCCLMGFIDDATSAVMHLQFVESESTEAYFRSIKEYLEKHGRPQALYTDRLSVFRINRSESTSKNAGLTQVGRALKELDIDLICANSPQAKGRIERLFNTLQDRLTKEMTLQGILSLEEANVFLPDYIKIHNAKFSVTPFSPEDLHRELLEVHNLEEILCYKSTRKLSKNLEISYEGRILQIETNRPSYSMRGAQVDVIESLDGDIKLFYGNQRLSFKELLVKDHQGRILDRKSLSGGAIPFPRDYRRS